jgi:hypothetical protein
MPLHEAIPEAVFEAVFFEALVYNETIFFIIEPVLL